MDDRTQPERQEAYHPPLIGREMSILLSVLAALVVCLGMVARQNDQLASYYEPIGYVAKIRALVEDGSIDVDLGTESGTPRLVIDPGLEGDPAFRSFRDESYLGEDIKRFNQGATGTSFYLRNGELKIDGSVRRVRLPCTPARGWKGSLSYRIPNSVAVLESDDLQIRIIKPDPSQLPLHVDQMKSISLTRTTGVVRAPGYILHVGTAKEPVCYIEFIGDNVVLQVAHNSIGVTVNSNPIPEGFRVRLDDGDVLFFQGPGVDRILFFKENRNVGDLSRIRLVNGRQQRIYSTGRLPLAEHLANAINRVVATSGSDDAEQTFDVALTVDEILHAQLQNDLEAYIWSERSKRYRTSPASITILDVTTGEVLALASYPTPEAVRDVQPDWRRDRLRQNQNLVVQPIGSAGKPFLAAAIWEAFPQLGSLRVGRVPSPITNTLGFELEGGFDNPQQRELSNERTDQRYPLDRVWFLKHSSNLYMVNLFLLSLACHDGDTVSFRQRSIKPNCSLNSEPVTREPDISQFYKYETESLHKLDAHEAMTVLESAFGIDSRSKGHADPAQSTYGKYDPEPWSILPRRLSPNPEAATAMFYVLPEKVNLRMNLIHRMRRDLVSLLLGGGNSHWPPLKLAEAMARIGTGSMVEARLVHSIREEGREIPIPSHDWERVPLSDQTLDWVREGLAAVATKGGTAASLESMINEWKSGVQAMGLQPEFYCKTGTSRRTDDGPNGGMLVFCLLVRNPDRTVVAGVSGTIYVDDQGQGGPAVTRRLGTGALRRCFEYLTGQLALETS